MGHENYNYDYEAMLLDSKGDPEKIEVQDTNEPNYYPVGKTSRRKLRIGGRR